jgi:hypothetical protein
MRYFLQNARTMPIRILITPVHRSGTSKLTPDLSTPSPAMAALCREVSPPAQAIGCWCRRFFANRS